MGCFPPCKAIGYYRVPESGIQGTVGGELGEEHDGRYWRSGRSGGGRFDIPE